jgi:hypothetical protein
MANYIYKQTLNVVFVFKALKGKLTAKENQRSALAKQIRPGKSSF